MSILRMYLTPADAQRPSHYREAWWEEETGEFVLHHGKVGESGTTTVEKVADADEAAALLDSLAAQNTTDGYLDVSDVTQESYRVVIRYKGSEPTLVETTNAEKFATEYRAILAWRGLGLVDDWHDNTDQASFAFHVTSVHRPKAAKLATEALKKTDFRADRLNIERN